MPTLEEQGTPEVELTPHEQEMIDLVDDKEAKAEGQADPEKAGEYQEDPKEAPEAIDYKAEYEKLKAAQEVPKDTQDTQTLEVPQGGEKPPEVPESPEDSSGTPKDDNNGQLTVEQMDSYTQEFNTNGKLSEESYKNLEKLGIATSVVDSYIQGRAAIQEAQATKAYDVVGGAENYEAMVTWAKDSWSPEQIEVFNSQVNSGDNAQIMFGVEALATQFKVAKGSPIPKRALTGSAQGTSGNTNSFETKAEMLKAIANPLYSKDASYNNMVMQKIANSNF